MSMEREAPKFENQTMLLVSGQHYYEPYKAETSRKVQDIRCGLPAPGGFSARYMSP
jgi:hypothetical protein